MLVKFTNLKVNKYIRISLLSDGVHILSLFFPLSTTSKCMRNTYNKDKTLKGVEKKADWLGTSGHKE